MALITLSPLKVTQFVINKPELDGWTHYYVEVTVPIPVPPQQPHTFLKLSCYLAARVAGSVR
jgi:hypothetical protein